MSEDQSMSEAKNEMTAQPCSSGLGQRDEDGEDFSDSCSDWVPSNEETESCDSDAETKAKKTSSERCKREYSRPNNESISPSNVAVADNIDRITLDFFLLLLRYCLYLGPVIIKEALAFDRVLRQYLEMLADLKARLGFRPTPLQSEVNVASTEQIVPIAPNLEADNELQGSPSQPNQSFDESKKKSSENAVFKIPCNKGYIIRKSRNVDGKNNEAAVEELVPIGSGMTLIPREKYKKINWKSYTIATRSLLVAVFPRRVLATHSLTGKPSPAFQDKAAKMSLDPRKTADVIAEVVDKFKVPENLVRSIITTKCADECKMWKTRCKKNGLKTKETTDTVQ